MPMRIETRNSVFELSDPGTGTFELKKIEDKTPGKRAKFQEGAVIKAKTYIAPRLGSPIVLKDGPAGAIVYDSKEPVIKTPTGNIR